MWISLEEVVDFLRTSVRKKVVCSLMHLDAMLSASVIPEMTLVVPKPTCC
jgi:hypothetical protein